jgi:Ras-related protein Rab-1A
MAEVDYLFRFFVVGDKGVGKSSLLKRFTADSFDPHIDQTIGVDACVRVVTLHEQVVKLVLWDMGGDARFRSMTEKRYRAAEHIVFVYDITDARSFAVMQGMVTGHDAMLRANGHTPTSTRLLIGNKCDRAAEREVATGDARSYAESMGMGFIEASALDGTNVAAAFLQMTSLVLQRARPVSSRGRTGGVKLPILSTQPDHIACEDVGWVETIKRFVRR